MRTEEDFLGKRKIRDDKYYGIQSLRASENFSISKNKIHPLLIEKLAQIKKAAALLNKKTARLEPEIADAVIKATAELVDHKFDDDIIVDPIQGGAGTSINMNVNEIIANRAAELLGKEKGKYDLVHPNNHVNMSQSTNDVIPTAINMTAVILLETTVEKLAELKEVFKKKAKEFDEVIKMGRTQLQDAVPIRLGQEFKAYQAVVGRDLNRLRSVIQNLKIVNMGATAVGTGINAEKEYINNIVAEINKVSKLNLSQADNLIDSTQNNDVFLELSSFLKIAAVNLSKIANDLRLLSSGPRAGINEINLPAVQPGSSIMPGKVNPVIPEVINQIAYQISGNDQTVTMAVEAGQLELNVMLPVLSHNLFESIEILTNGVNTFANKAVKNITVNQEECQQQVEKSIGIITAFTPYLGYEKCSNIAQKALAENKNIRELIAAESELSAEKIDQILDFYEMTKIE